MVPQGSLAANRADDLATRFAAVAEFPHVMRALLEQHRPSRMPFFRRVPSLPREAASDPYFLGQIHLNYQSAMHAMRAALYHLPHLDSPALRRRKLHVLLDSDGQAADGSPHHRLSCAFRSIGADLVLDDEEFGEPEEMCCFLDGESAHFVRLTQTLYARSLGAWCAAETMSGDWTTALAEAFGAHFPSFRDEPCFADCLAHSRGEHRAAQALPLTETVLRERPELLPATLRDAKIMAEALDGVWTHLDRITQNAWMLAAPRRRPA